MGTRPEHRLAGKRAAERRAVDLRIELRGGGILLHGRASDLSERGVGVRLGARAFEGFREVHDMLGVMRLLDRHLARGVEVRFPSPGDVRVNGQIVRVFTAPGGATEEVAIGIRFARPLSPVEWAAVLGLPPPPPRAPMRDLVRGRAVEISAYDALRGAAQGPVATLRVVRAAEDGVEVVFAGGRVVSAAEARELLDRGPLDARMTSADGLAWRGPLRLVELREGTGGVPYMRLEAMGKLPAELLLRLAKA